MPQSPAALELRGLTKLVKIKEDGGKYEAEQGITEEAALEVGLREKAKESVKKVSEVYAKA